MTNKLNIGSKFIHAAIQGCSTSLPGGGPVCVRVYEEESSSTGWRACLFSSVFNISTSRSASFSFLRSVSLAFWSFWLSWERHRRFVWCTVPVVHSRTVILLRGNLGPDTHRFQRFIVAFALLLRLLGHNRRSVFPLGAVPLFPLGHRAGTRGEDGRGWDQQRRLKAAGVGGCRGKLGALCLGAVMDPPRPQMGGDRGVWAPVFAVIWRVGERTFFWTCRVQHD